MRISRIIISMVAMLSIVTGVMLVSAQEDTARPFLGINIEPAEDGAAVLRVLPDSPAAEAGLERGDIITAVNGETVDADTLANMVGSLDVGDEVSLDVLRDDETMQLTATLAEQPERPERGMFPFGGDFQVQRAYLGVSLESTDDGVRIAAVSDASPAADAGLQEGDLITAVNGTDVAEPADVAGAIRDLAIGDTVTLSITRAGEAQDIDVTLGSMMNQMSTMMGDAVVYDGENWQVLSLSDDNPLATAGVQAGDVITAIDGNVYDPAGLQEYLDGLADDATVTLTIERSGETQDITVNAADLDALNAFSFGFGRGIPGFRFDGPRGEFMTSTGRLGVAYEDQDNGALITDVVADSPAAEAGLQVDDVVTAVNGDKVDAERTLRERLFAYDPGDTVTLDVLRDGETVNIDVTLAEVNMEDMMGEFPFGEFRRFFGPDGEFPFPQVPQQPQAPSANV